MAVQNAIHYQADQIESRKKLGQAQAAEQRKDLATAAQLYDDAWALANEVGPSAQAEQQIAAAGIASVRMQLAMEAQHHGDYNEADIQVKDILRVSPENQMAQQFKMANDRLIEASRGTKPSPGAMEEMKVAHEENVQTAQLVQDAKLMFQLGKIDEAENRLNEALKRDPSNQAALYYLSLVKQARAKQVVDARDVTSMNRMVEVEKGWADNDARKNLPIPNLYARTNMIYTSAGKQRIFEKLNNIMFDKISFPSLQLSEVIRNLTEQTERRDIDQQGINFLLDREKPAAPVTTTLPGQPGAQPQFDPTTGQPIIPQAAPAEEVDLGTVTISLDPGLKNVRLADVLEAIVASADHPIKYSIRDYGIAFSLKGPESPELHTRTFKVDPNTFYMGLQNVGVITFGAVATGGGGGGGGGGGAGGQSIGATTIPRVDVTGNGNQAAGGGGGGGGGGQPQGVNIAGAAGQAQGAGGAGGNGNVRGLRYVTGLDPTVEIQLAVINFFNAVGVNLAPPKSVFFNDRQGTLTVRATSDDLDLIEQAIETLNIAPPEVTVKTRFVEVNQNDSKALGFDWYLGNFLMGGKNVVASGGSQPSFTGNPSLPANSGGSFPGDPNFGTTIAPSTSDTLLTGGLRNSINNVNVPAVATVTGILTDPQFRVVLHALEQRDGADLLNQGEVTTLSGRQASFQVADIQTIVTGAPANSTGATATPAGTGGLGGNVIQNQGASINYTLQSSPYGTTLDVVPYVCADGYTIQMTLIPTVTEFVGYDNPGNFIPTIVTGSGGIPLTGQLPLPRSRVRQVVTSCIVWDGQTVVLGGLITESVQRQKDKVPFLGDLPGLGRLFRSEANFTQRKNLIVFVTPTIIDPSGNRRNSEAEMPFAATSIPPQPQ